VFGIGVPKVVDGLIEKKGVEVNWAAWMPRGV